MARQRFRINHPPRSGGMTAVQISEADLSIAAKVLANLIHYPRGKQQRDYRTDLRTVAQAIADERGRVLAHYARLESKP
jgi:hypothetical protein